MKTMSASQIQPQRKFRARNRLLAAAVSSCFVATVAWGNPVAPTVVNGTATFSQTGNVLTVTNSNGAIINWNKFSIGSGETTYFLQSSASSSVLNRVLSADPSVILGTLGSNGKVWLINPAGIMVGAGARVDVAGFVASTLNVTDANFLAGKLLFDATPGAGSVVNQGGITTPSGGSVYLIAPNVQNTGVITTPSGEAILAAGQTVALIDTGTPGVKVEITGAEGNATNLGTILADAGRIGMAGVLVRNSGTLNASSVVNEGGRIFLKASQDAYVDGNGRIVTTGTKGGSVEVLGNRVAVMDNASIDASGGNGGGTVLIGGDYQGNNPTIQNSQITYVGAGTTIKADATSKGDGGKVVVWSDDITRAYGAIYARAGIQGGNGGLVETSGHRYLDVFGIHVDTTAVKGQVGTWLLDPNTIDIYSSGTPENFSGGSFSGGVFSGSSGAATIYGSTLLTQLGTTDVKLQTSGASGDVTFYGGSYDFSSSSHSLSVFAFGGNIEFLSGVDLRIGGGLNLYAGWTGSGTNVTAGTGEIGVVGASLRAASMDWKAGSNISIYTDASYSSLVQSSGNQTMAVTGTAGWISVRGGYTASNRSATLQSLSGTQTLQADIIGVYGGTGSVDGSYGLISANGTQNINLTGSGFLNVQGGGYMGAGSQDFAKIEQLSSGGTQNITFASGGLINVYGGDGLADAFAKIDGHGGSTTIGSSTSRPDIYLRGGSLGGQYDHGNEGSIGLDDLSTGTLTVYGAGVTITGGTASFGGSGFGASTQRFYLSGNLNMLGGSSTQMDTDVPGGTAYIGGKYGADIQITTTGGVHLQGGTGSPVVIGSLSGTANVSITTGSAYPVTIQSDIGGAYGGVFIGSRAELAPAANGFFANDVMLGSHTSIMSGGDVNIRSYGGNVGLGYVKAMHNGGYGAYINAYGAILDQNGSSLNVEADTIQLTSLYGGSSSGLAVSADTKITSATGSLAVIEGSSGYSTLYGGISIRNTDAVGFGQTGTISLRDYASYGGNLSFFNTANLTLNSSSFTASTVSGDLLIATSGHLTSTGFVGHVAYGGSMLLGAGGNVNITGSTYAADPSNFYKQDLGVVAGGNINIQGALIGSNVVLTATGDLNVTGAGYADASDGTLIAIASNVNIDKASGSWGYLSSYDDMNIVANNVTLTNGGHIEAGIYQPNPLTDISIAVKGNLRINNGSYIMSGNDIYVDLFGSNSTIYLNDGLSPNQTASYMWADAYGQPTTTHLDFIARSSGGIVINGVNMTTPVSGGSGFFNGYTLSGFYPVATPAVVGQGLDIQYGVVDNPVVKVLTDIFNNTTDKSNLTDTATKASATTLVLKPVGTTTTGNQTTGGDGDDSFGSNEKDGNQKDKDNGKPTTKNQCS